MRKRCIEGYAAAAFLVVARATITIMVDDGDPGIQYHGTWVHNLIKDPTDLNYGGSVTFTNVSGSTATYKFTGTAIAVFGAFEVAGTYSMHSTYSIDGGPATDFIPASTTVWASYRQKFFQSDTLSDGEHTLVIANVGRELWLDYLQITPPGPQPTTTTTSTLSQNVQATSASTTQAPPPTTGPATTGSSSAGQSVTTQSGSGPSSQTQTTHSFSNTNNVTLTSTDAAVPPPPATSSTSQSGTSTPASGIASPTSTPALVHSSKLAAGAIAGLAVAALVLILIVLVGLVGWRSRRRKQAHRRDDLTPYNPGLTALAAEPSEKQDIAHDSGSRGSTATSLLSLSQPKPIYTGTQAPAESSGPEERSVPHEIQTTDLDGMRMGRDRRTGFEPLGSPSSASPLLARHPHGGRQQQKDSPITSSAGLSRYTIPLDERRRSVDGGVRIAGGPPGNLGQEDDPLGDSDADDDVRSGLSTLPPSYQLYTAV